MLATLPPAEVGQNERQLDVFESRQHGNEIVELENEADMRGAPGGQLDLGERGDLDRANADRAGVRPVQPGDQIEQGAFPEPEGPMRARNSPWEMESEMSSSTGMI